MFVSYNRRCYCMLCVLSHALLYSWVLLYVMCSLVIVSHSSVSLSFPFPGFHFFSLISCGYAPSPHCTIGAALVVIRLVSSSPAFPPRAFDVSLVVFLLHMLPVSSFLLQVIIPY